MTATFQLRRHLRTVEAAGTPAAIAERAVHNRAKERAAQDVRARFPVITPENFEAADEYRRDRLAHHSN